MELTASYYRILFSKFKDKLYQNEFKEAVESNHSQKEIWHTPATDGNGRRLSESFMSNRFRISPMLLTQKLTEANTKATIPIKDFTFVRMMEYLEDIPPELGYRGTEWKAHANALKEKFIHGNMTDDPSSDKNLLPQYVTTYSLPGLEIVIHLEFKKK